ncbi:MAG: O-antigen ligase family protein [Anaplasmataceae bacterium]|nr:O-antigen ligase family protein [Anaplasmataceae bacterium]
MFLKTSKFFLYAALFCVVLVVSGSFFPFIGGKYFFFRAMVALSAAAFLLSWAFEDPHDALKERMKAVAKMPLFIAVSAFVLVMLLAAVFAHDPHAAFWSNYERGDGGYQMLHYYLFFSLLLLLVRTWKEWKITLWLFVIAAFLMVGYGVLGYLNVYNCNPARYPENQAPISCTTSPAAQFITAYQSIPPDDIPKTFVGVFSGNRFQGSLGNPAYVAPYLIFAMSFALILWLLREEKDHQKNKAKSSWGHLWWLLLVLYFFTFFILAQTRGAFLGLLIGLGVAQVYLAILLPKARKWVVSILLAGLIVVSSLFIFRDNPAIASLPVSRLFDINLTEFTAQTRFWTWGSAWEGIKERPILGWGQENFSTVFDRHFDTRHFNPQQISETWFDRAHSIFFDYAATTGLLGLLSYLVMLGVAFWPYLKLLWSKGVHSKEAGVSAVIVGLGVAYFVQGLVLFDVLSIYLGLFTALAFVGFFADHLKTTHAPHHG